MYTQDTIAAIATPPGVGAIAIIRVSGLNLQSVYYSLTKKTTFQNKQASYLPVYGNNGGLVDTCMVVYIKGPLSYTGEDIIEINCHGGNLIPKLILSSVLAIEGVRLAENGEFSKRAFLNGKIDLTQAEAIASLISSKSEVFKNINLNNSLGFVSKKINTITEKLVKILTIIEHELDFNENEVNHVSQGDIKRQLIELKDELGLILQSTLYTNKISSGYSVVICGKPNAGKSSLFNALLGVNRNIVSDEIGTTRDSVEVNLEIHGVPINLIDTAGYMKASKKVDKEAVEKTIYEIKNADILLVVDDHNPNDQLSILNIEEKKCIAIKTKSDLHKRNIQGVINVSAKNGDGLSELKDIISTSLSTLSTYNYSTDVLITSRRQQSLISNSFDKITELVSLMDKEIDMVIASTIIRDIADKLDMLVGKIYNEQLLDNIFNDFCVGK